MFFVEAVLIISPSSRWFQNPPKLLQRDPKLAFRTGFGQCFKNSSSNSIRLSVQSALGRASLWMQFALYSMRYLKIVILLVSTSLAYDCGVRKVTINKAIVRGQDSLPGEWPWHVAVYHKDGSREEYACGGSLISEVFVLTADHCVRGENGQVLSIRRIFVRLGAYHLLELDWRVVQQRGVGKIHVYGSSTKLKNDVAIVEVDEVVEFSDFVQPVCVNQVRDLTDQFGTAVGWGFTENDETSPILKGSSMPVVSTNECLQSDRDTFGATLEASLFCAGYTNGTTVCNGDSGGGLHFERGGSWYVGGIVSFTALRASGFLCYAEGYAGFTNVYHFLPWIQNVTGLVYLANGTAVASSWRLTDIKPISFGPVVKSSNVTAVPKYQNYLPWNCGRYLVNRIVQGTAAQQYEFPWMALLLDQNKTWAYKYVGCVGSLISKRYVLTNAYCTSDVKPHYVQLGDYDREHDPDCSASNSSDCAPPTRIVEIEGIIQHSEYNETSERSSIALIRLKQAIVFEDHIQPVCLPVPQWIRNLKLKKYIITGWGDSARDDDDYRPEVLQKATVSTIGLAECQRKHNSQYYVDEGIICTGKYGTPGTCDGDDGGPLGYLVNTNGIRFVQFGITIVGYCGDGPNRYIDVAYHMDWIMANMKP